MISLFSRSKFGLQFRMLLGFTAMLLISSVVTSCQSRSGSSKEAAPSDSTLSVLTAPPVEKVSSPTSSAAIESHKVLQANAGALGTYQGTIDNQYFKLSIQSVSGDRATGSVEIGDLRKKTAGKIIQLGSQPVPGGKVMLYRLILSETATGPLGGEYLITLSLGSNSASGEGNWMSHNKKQIRMIGIKEKVK